MMTQKFTTIFLSLIFFINYPVAAEATYTTIFAHGLGGNALHGMYYREFIGSPIIGENGPEWESCDYEDYEDIGLRKSCLAQDADIEIIEKQIRSHLQENIVLLGISKGAATMLNTVGWLADNKPEYLNNIKAVIVDSPFASPETVAMGIVANSFGESSKGSIESTLDTSIMHSIIKKLETKLYPNYNPYGITPIKSVTQAWKNVDKDMVIIFIHSQKDKLISINDSRILYLELKKLGFTNLYLIEAVDGAHGNVFWGPDKKAIFKKLCLIYKKHNLPLPQLNEEDIQSLQDLYEEQGGQLLSDIQPSFKEIKQRMNPWLYKLGFI